MPMAPTDVFLIGLISVGGLLYFVVRSVRCGSKEPLPEAGLEPTDLNEVGFVTQENRNETLRRLQCDRRPGVPRDVCAPGRLAALATGAGRWGYSPLDQITRENV